MRAVAATLLMMVPTGAAVAQSDLLHAGGGEFSGFKIYWAEQREGCQPMISFRIKNVSTGEIGPMVFRMEVVDRDATTIFASGTVSVSPADVPPGHTKAIAIGGNRDISSHDCLGDMHEPAFSGIHFAVRVTATIGQDPARVELVSDQPMTEERVPAQN